MITSTEIYTIVSETEKAIKIKYPYYEKTSEYKPKHKQKYIEQWIPKSVKNVEQWIEGKMHERGFNMKFIGMGIAPAKVEIEPLIINDVEKIEESRKKFYDKVFELTGVRPHHRSGFDADGACFNINGKTYDFEQEYEDMKKYKPTLSIKQYK